MSNLDMSNGAAPAYVDVTTASFMNEVIEASKAQPVLVDFWATWCGPCKQLAPMIEKVVGETNGSVKLAKMDIDKHPEVAGQMGIQSIPAVIAFVDGKPADGFMGAKPESEIRAFVEKVAGPEAFNSNDGLAEALEQAQSLVEAGDHAQASSIYSAILAQEPQHLAATAGLGECYLGLEQLAQAREFADALNDEQKSDPAVHAFMTRLELAEKAEELGDISGLAEKAKANPSDNQAVFDYAVALNGRDMRNEAAEQLLSIIRRDREWQEDGARTQLVQFLKPGGQWTPPQWQRAGRCRRYCFRELKAYFSLCRPAIAPICTQTMFPTRWAFSRWSPHSCCRVETCRLMYSSHAIWRWWILALPETGCSA